MYNGGFYSILVMLFAFCLNSVVSLALPVEPDFLPLNTSDGHILKARAVTQVNIDYTTIAISEGVMFAHMRITSKLTLFEGRCRILITSSLPLPAPDGHHWNWDANGSHEVGSPMSDTIQSPVIFSSSIVSAYVTTYFYPTPTSSPTRSLSLTPASTSTPVPTTPPPETPSPTLALTPTATSLASIQIPLFCNSSINTVSSPPLSTITSPLPLETLTVS